MPVPPRDLPLDHPIDADLVGHLLAEQHPDLAGLPRHVVAEGWDNVLVRVGDDLCVRLPRRAQGVPLIEHEQRWLPALAPRLPVVVPVPVRVGAPSPRYPWPWTVTRWVSGARSADRPRRRAAAWAVDLADALAALHTTAPPDAPHNPVRAVPLATRVAAVTARFDRARAGSGAVPLEDVDLAEARWRAGVAAPAWAHAPAWVHGDPHPANLVVTPGADDGARGDALAALLDFGDLSAGDPACDLATAWLAFDASGRAAFVAAYEARRPGGPGADRPDPGRWRRAGAWAVAMATGVLVDAPEDPTNGPWARAALDELVHASDAGADPVEP